jgi:flagellar operon protein (TIGR03826 family)
MNLDYCPRCGKLFAKGFRDICPNCLKEIEADYEKCVAYLKEHRNITIQQLSEATGVSVRQITRFIREGRIGINAYPDMYYGCESCGTPIREGNMCPNCLRKLANEIKAQQAIDARLKADAQSERLGAYQIKQAERLDERKER